MEYSKLNFNGVNLVKKRLNKTEINNQKIIYKETYPPTLVKKSYPEKDTGKNISDFETEELKNENEKNTNKTVSNTTVHKKISFLRIMCGVLSVVLMFTGIYLSKIEAPLYIQNGIMTLMKLESKYRRTEENKIVSQKEKTKSIGEKYFVEENNKKSKKENENVQENSNFAESVKEQITENNYVNIEKTAQVINEEDEKEIKTNIIAKNMSQGNDKIYLTNRTNLKIDADELLSREYPIEKYTLKTDEPLVLIVHTHGTEAYINTGENGKTRTQNTDKNIVKVGEELQKALEMYGIPTLHSKTMHDAVSYVNAYANSKKEVQQFLKDYPSIKYVIDVHRDAVGTEEEPIKTYTEINGEGTAQLMFVMGTNASGGNHPQYMNNLSVVANIQKTANEIYPSLMRPINIRPIIFNQNLADGCMILEVGSDANTLEEALSAVRMFAGCFARTVTGESEM